MKRNIASLAAAGVLALACAAQAQQMASTMKTVHLRAGPGLDYPVVAILAPGTPVSVYGCLPQYTWCDVLAGPERGWVYAGNLSYAYDGRTVILPGIAAAIGIGIAGFAIDDYWGHYYTDRPWWPERRRWYRPPHAPPGHRNPYPPSTLSGAPGTPFGPPVGPPRVEPGPQDRIAQPAVPREQPRRAPPRSSPPRRPPPDQH